MKKIISIILALILSISFISSMGVTASAYIINEPDFDVSISWSGISTISDDIYMWHSESAESKVARLSINYSNKNAPLTDYAAGEISISINGMGRPFRTDDYAQADSIAADKMSDTIKKHKWSYDYDTLQDVYTFTNNDPILGSEPFVGAFELVWYFNARDIKNGFSAVFLGTVADREGSKFTNEIGYGFTSDPDEFSLDLLAEPIQNYSVLQEYASVSATYRWVKYKITRNVNTKSRGLASYHYLITPGEDTIVLNSDLVAVENGAYKATSAPQYYEVIVGYKESTYMTPPTHPTAGITVQMVGQYFETLSPEVITTENTSVDLVDFDFFAGSYEKIADNSEKIDYNNLFNGNQEITFFIGDAKLPQCTSIVTDDVVEILLNNGTYRFLNPNEYEITEAYFPENSLILDADVNAIPPNTTNLEIRALTTGSSNYTTVYSAPITETGSWITMPQNTYKVEYRWTGASTEGYRHTAAFKTKMIFHLDSESGLSYENKVSASGGVINNVRYEMYDGDTEMLIIATKGAATHSQALNAHDMEEYGRIFARSGVLIPVTSTDNYCFTDTSLDKFVAEDDILTSQESMETCFFTEEPDSDATITSFVQYSILPVGMEIDIESFDYNIDTSESSLILDDGTLVLDVPAYLKAHASLDIDEGYKHSDRICVECKYDFSDNPIAVNGFFRITTKFPVYVTSETYMEISDAYTARTSMKVNTSSVPFTVKPDAYNGRITHTAADDGTYFNADAALWSDIDHNENTTESILYNYFSRTIVAAMAYHLETKESVKTAYTNGKYITNKAVTQHGGAYSYKLGLTTGPENLDNIAFTTILESTEDANWRGTFQGLDLTYIESLGLTTTVYYSNSNNPSTNIGSNDWSAASGPNVRAIHVEINEIVPKNSYIYFTIDMLAPSEPPLIGVTTENVHYVSFSPIDSITLFPRETETFQSNKTRIQIVDNIGDLKITKTDESSGSRLAGAEFEIYKTAPEEQDSLIRTVRTNATGTVTVPNLDYGTYYISETTAPMGYESLDHTIPFTIDENAFSPGSTTVLVSIENSRKLGTVTLYKGNSFDESIPVNGAIYSLYRSNGTLFRDNCTTNDQGIITETDVEWGSYYFIEKSAAPGYEINESQIPFDVNATNVSETIELTTTDVPKVASARLTKYERETDSSSVLTNPVSGAKYSVYRVKPGGNILHETNLVTDVNGQITTTNLMIGEYYFIEIARATGYELNPNVIPFTITADDCDAHSVINVDTSDVRIQGRAMLIKTNESSTPVADAVYTLYDENDDIYLDDLSTDSEGHILVQNLPWGNYYFLEKSAPTGYSVSNDELTFAITRINCEGLQVVSAVNTLSPTSVRLHKVDANDNSILLSGAQYSLYKNDGTLYGDNYTTNEEGYFVVTNVPWGSYYFVEKTAPAGYAISDEKVRFSVNIVNAGTTLDLYAEDSTVSHTITVTKRILAENINWFNGNPTFMYKLENYRSDPSIPATSIYNAVISFDRQYVLNNTDVNGYVEKSATISNLAASEYILTENKTIRYDIDTITTPENAAGVVFIANDGSLLSQRYGTGVYFDIATKDTSGSATYTNQMENWGRASGTSTLVNAIKPERKIIGISAHSRLGPISVSSASEIDKAGLSVYAIYDDGSNTLLGNDDYTFTDQNFATNVNGNYTVEIVYSTGEKTFTCTFQIKTDIRGLFTVDTSLGDNKCAITGYLGTSPVLAFPAIYDDMTVTAIGDGLQPVVGVDNVTTLVIPDSVTVINDVSLQPAYMLSDVTMPISARIAPSAFPYAGITTFTITPGTGIGCDYEADAGYMPWFAAPSTLILQDGITKIGNNMFCYGQISGTLTIPDSVTSIGDRAFAYCTNITEIYLGSSLQSIGSECFANIPSIATITIPDSVTIIKDSAFYYCGQLETVNFSDSLETIGDNAFAWCFGGACLNEVNLTLPNSLTHIGESAFSDATMLKTITIGNQIETIGEYAFSGSITTVTIDKPFDSVSGAPWDNYPCDVTIIWNTLPVTDDTTGLMFVTANDQAAVVGYVGSEPVVTIPATYNGLPVTKIASKAFYQNNIITSVTVPDSVTEIGPMAFSGSQLLTTFNFNPNITKYGIGAFEACTSLSSPLIFSTTEAVTIGEYAFAHSSSLTGTPSLSQLDTIPASAFAGCTSLVFSFDFSSSLTQIGRQAFMGCNGNGTTITIPSSVTSIEISAFESCDNIPGVIFNNTLTELSGGMFQNCTSITNIVFGSAITQIGASTFSGCTGLTGSLAIPSQVTNIGPSAFAGCTGITGTLVLPSNLTVLGSSAFMNCTGLTSVTFNAWLSAIPATAFSGCTNLAGVITLPNNIRSIATGAFANCQNITDVYIYNKTCTITNSASVFYRTAKIHGYANSTAKTYATKYIRTFVTIT